jgi:phage shock protein A
MKAVEDSHARKISELKAKLAAVETSVADALNRKKLAEDALADLRQRVS